MRDRFDKYEEQLIKKIIATNEAIRQLYEEMVNQITFTASKYTYKGRVFDLRKYPVLKAQVDAAIEKLHGSIYAVAVNSINDSWDLSNVKNKVLVDERLKERSVTPEAKRILYDPNKEALNQFVKRENNGLNLSDRVWKTLEPLPNELTKSLGVGISEGMPARKMASEVQQYLKEPDKLFRRVRDAKGKLQLSKAAEQYKPGRGIYRSSFQNALRLAATETNIAYRSADYERWKNSPLLKGIEVRLSDAHPRFDICDHLVGRYPKDYKHTGFHPRCLCYAVPILTSNDDFDILLDNILGNSDKQPKDKGIKKVPAKALKWIEKNAGRLSGYKSLPYFIRDNPQYYGEFFD